MSVLEKKLDSLIAQEDNVRPEDVTLEYIRRMRDCNPNITYDFTTRYGGYNRRGKRVLTPAQSANIIVAGYRYLSRFGRQR